MASKMPNGDVWKLTDNDSNSQHYGKKFKFDFSYIESDSIKNISKNFVWRNYIEQNNSLNGLYKCINPSLSRILDFLNKQRLSNLRDLNNNHIEMFLSYLNTLISPKGKPYSTSSKKMCIDLLKSIIRWGQLYMPNAVPKINIFIGNEYIGVNRKLKIDFIPDEVLEQINKALVNEENPYVKYGIIILQSTGMRIGDMLKLTINSVKPHLISGYTLTWYDHKNKKERYPVPITNECALAIQKLIEYTKELRKQADCNIQHYLFIHKVSNGKDTGKVSNITVTRYCIWLNGQSLNNKQLKGFVHKHNILDANGEIYNLSAHQFRRTLATDMLSKGTDLKAIQEILGHSSPMTTKQHYADVKDKERAEIFKNIGIIGNVNKVDETIITDKKDLIWFNQNKDKGARMEDGYCTKPCTNGKICDRLLKRQKCYTCSRYITTPEYLQAHKNHLAELEKQLEGNIYGGHYAEHFLPTIEILKEIVKRLEEIQDGNN